MINLLIILFLEFNNCNKNELFVKKFNNNTKNNHNYFNQSFYLDKTYLKKNLIFGLEIIASYKKNLFLAIDLI